MFRVQTDHSLDALLPNISKAFKTKAGAINTAHKFMQTNPQDGVIVVTDSCHEAVAFLVRDDEITGGIVQEMTPDDWEAA